MYNMLWDRGLLVQDSLSKSKVRKRFSSTELSSSSALIAFLTTSAAQMTPGGQTKNIARAIKTFIAAKAILGAQIATVSVTVIPNAVHIQIFVPKNLAAILYINAVFRKETRGLQTVTVNATVESIAASMRVTPIPLTRTADAQKKKCAVPDRPVEKIPFVVDATR